MCSNEVLKERIDNLIIIVNKVSISLETHIKDQVDMLDKLDNRYPTRREMKAVKRAWWILISLVWLLSSLWIIAK